MVVSNIFYFHPYLGKSSNFDQYFSDGLKPPTRRWLDFCGDATFFVRKTNPLILVGIFEGSSRDFSCLKKSTGMIHSGSIIPPNGVELVWVGWSDDPYVLGIVFEATKNPMHHMGPFRMNRHVQKTTHEAKISPRLKIESLWKCQTSNRCYAFYVDVSRGPKKGPYW